MASKKEKPTRPKRFPKFPTEVDQSVTLDAAVELTRRYRKASPASEHGGFFWARGIEAILAQPGCIGVRYYHGLDSQGRYQNVWVGVDKDGNDIVRKPGASSQKSAKSKRGPSENVAATSSDAVILDTHWPCPPICPWGSPLN